MDIENTTRHDNPARPALRMPMQAAPVRRAGEPGGGPSADGVEADFDWSSVLGTLGTVARAAAPVIGNALGI